MRQPIVVAPWPRLHDRALDSFLDRLAHTLATEAPFETLSSTPEGHAAIANASALYRQALSHFAPKLLAVRAIEVREGQPRLTLTLESGPHEPPFARFEFELVVHAGELSIVRLLDPAAYRESIECAIETRELAGRAERARAERKTDTFCNGLGTVLPGPWAVPMPRL